MSRGVWMVLLRRVFSQIAKPPKSGLKGAANTVNSTNNTTNVKIATATTNLIPRGNSNNNNVPQFTGNNSNSEYFRYELQGMRNLKLSRAIADAFNIFNGHYYVHRSSIIDTIISNLNESKSPVVMDGGRGVGKSVIVLQLAAHLRAQGKKVVYFPDVSDWTSGRSVYYPEGNEGAYMQSDLAAFILKSIQEQLAMKADETHTDAYSQLRNTFESLSSAESTEPIYVLLDGANDLIANKETGYNDSNGNKVLLKDLIVPNYILSMLSKPNFKCILSTTKSNPDLIAIAANANISDALIIPKFNVDEVRACLQLYRQLGYLTANNNSGDFEEFVKFKAFVSGGNARLL